MNKITNIFRNKLLTELTGNLGKVEVTNDAIICYVDNKKIQKKFNNSNCAYLIDFSSTKILTKELLEKYGINKPVHYIVEGIRFKEKLFFTTDKDIKVLFKGCKFHKQIRITSADKVIFENNKYFDRYPVYAFKNKFLSGRANSIQFISDSFVNSGKDYPTQFGMDLIVNKFEIINSNIDIEGNLEESFIMADKIILINSSFMCPSTYMICNNIDVTDSKIIASEGIIIDEKENNNTYSNIIDSIESPSITYNGLQQQRISDEEIAKKYHRLELLKVLKIIKNSCIHDIDKKLDNERKELNQKTIGQIKR